MGLSLCRALSAESWEFDPYAVRVWLAAGESPQVSAGFLDQVAAGLKSQADVTVASAWQMEVATAPAELADDLLLDVPPAYLRLKETDDKVGGFDKIFAVRIDVDAGEYVLAGREYDVRMRKWGLPVERRTPQREQVPFTAWDVVQGTFAPVMRVEKVDEKTIVGRLRAGGLIIARPPPAPEAAPAALAAGPASPPVSLPEKNPAALEPGDPLQPVLRRNDRSGEPLANIGVSFIPWSVVEVKSCTGGLVTGEMNSGIRFPLPSRGGVRTERLCVKFVQNFPSTRITFDAKSKDNKPLEGYEVYTKAPGAKDADLLGKTDWQGAFEVLPSKNPFQILYIRSGGRLLARLPIVAGAERQAEVRLADDQIRLQAEGLVAAIQSRITDLVAKREIYKARVRIFSKNGKFDDAKKLVDEFRKLETFTELRKDIREYRSSVQTADKNTTKKIDQSFNDLEKLASSFLTTDAADKLEQEIALAKNPPPPPPPPPPANLVEARQRLQTKLLKQEADGTPVPPPPGNFFQVVKYKSPAGELSAYLTPNPNDNQKKPAIIWITGGDCETIGDVWTPGQPADDQTAAQYRNAGIVMMYPSLRGGNDNPGKKEQFLGEVDDVIAAADFLATQPHVDPTRIYLGGHSTGGTLALLVAECTGKFRAVFSFGPVSDTRGYYANMPPVYDTAHALEYEARSPGRWLASITSPTFVIEGVGTATDASNIAALREMAAASKNPQVKFLEAVGKNHFSVLAPVNQTIATKIVADNGPTCNITLTAEEVSR